MLKCANRSKIHGEGDWEHEDVHTVNEIRCSCDIQKSTGQMATNMIWIY